MQTAAHSGRSAQSDWSAGSPLAYGSARNCAFLHEHPGVAGREWLARPWATDAGVFLLYTLLSVVFTWPLAIGLAELAPAHFDPPFTAWRLGWIAHQIGHPGHLFDGNIFWPDRRTLAYSDAVLLQGVLGAPLAALGANPNGIANVLILVGAHHVGVLRLSAGGAG